MTEGNQNLTISQYVITEHVDPPQSVSLYRNMKSVEPHTVKSRPLSSVLSQQTAVWRL